MIRFLIDENLPATLATKLSVPCQHVHELGHRLTDEQLWDHAKQQDWIILTKDADFFDRLTLQGPPPKIVWVRTGILRRSTLENLLTERMPDLLRLLAQADLVEVHDTRLESFKFH